MKDTLPVRVRFGAFELDPKAGELRLGELRIVLQEQSFQILQMLVERAGELVTRDEIQKKLWPNDTIVEFDHSINVALGKLRKALVDPADDPKYIETVARRGYRLMVPVERAAAAPGDSSDCTPLKTPTQAKEAWMGHPHGANLSGKTVSHYRVLEVVGGGGMGVVYRAEDLKLGRAVALKFLPEELGDDPKALERFEREARAASALDHPNICSIYEFGDHGGQPFIVMQLLEGETLRDRLASTASQASGERAFSVDPLLDVAVQVATGLEAAHESGIIHRDIKPANIFLTKRGLVKILDFGVAKLIATAEKEQIAQTQGGEDLKGYGFSRAVQDTSPLPSGFQPATDFHLTRTGLAMGTAGYMSPEQVRGEQLDARTDLFSFGLVLYEMAAGQRAFSGDTAAVVRDAILNQTPVPLRELNSTLPATLVNTIDKALEKDRARRWQSAAEMRDELEPVRSDKQARVRRRVLILAIAVSAIVLLLAYLFRPAMPLPRVSRVVQVTKSGGAVPSEPLYTDGPRVYYQSIGPLAAEWQLRQVLLNGNDDTPADLPVGRFLIRGLSPDDTEFLALSHDGQWTVWTIPVANGSPRRIGNLVADDIAWSHDGGWFAYARGKYLFLAKSDGTASRSLAIVPVASGEIEYVRWSPDDRQLRFTLSTSTTQALWEVNSDGSNLRKMPFHWPGKEKEMECCGDWMPDGRHFVFSSGREGISNLWALEEKSDLWRRASRDPVQLTSGPVNYYQPIPSRNGSSILAIGAQPSGELVRYDADRKDFVAFLGGQSVSFVEFSRDGQWVAYVDYPEGTLSRARSDGTERLQLTFPPLHVGILHWSPDGKRIAFHATCPGCLSKGFVISADGGNPEPLPSEPLSQACPDWMPVGDALIYSRAYGAENPGLYRFDLRSGRSEKIPGTDGLYGPIWSPDGRYLSAVDAATDLLLLVDLKSGKRTQIAGPARWPTWSADSQYLYFVRDRIKGLLRVHVPDGKEEKTLEVPFRVAYGPVTLAPDGSPIMLREHGRYDVYSLTLSLP
jgi:eukaryotic-like serine/threonine-protein kinase